MNRFGSFFGKFIKQNPDPVRTKIFAIESHYAPVVMVLSIYNVYSMIMSAVKRLPVSEKIWKELGAMKGAGQTYDDLLEDMIERVKKARLEEDVKMWESTPDSEYVSLSEIKD